MPSASAPPPHPSTHDNRVRRRRFRLAFHQADEHVLQIGVALLSQFALDPGAELVGGGAEDDFALDHHGDLGAYLFNGMELVRVLFVPWVRTWGHRIQPVLKRPVEVIDIREAAPLEEGCFQVASTYWPRISALL